MKTAIIFPLISLVCLIGTTYAQYEQPISQSKDIFHLETKQHKGYGPLWFGLTIFSEQPDSVNSPWDACSPSLTGLPDTLDRMVKGSIFIDNEQILFQTYKAGQLDTSFFQQMLTRTDMDTLRLSSSYIKSFVSLASGYDSMGKLVVVVDQNLNFDLSDDPFYYLTPPPNNFREHQEVMEKTLIPFSYETFHRGQLDTVSSWIYLGKIETSSPFGPYLQRAKHELGLVYNFASHYLTPFSYGDTTVMLGMHDSFSSYDQADVTLLKDTPEGLIPDYNVKRGQYLILGDEYFLVDQIRPDGGAITLIRDPEGAEKEMPQERMKAPSFSTQTLSGKEVNLSDYKGKYVFLDFWGSWCMPCIAELPELKHAYDIFHGDHFDIIGIAFDDSIKFTDYLAKDPLAWEQILQIPDRPGGDKLIKQYDVTKFPTTFLIDPQGKILHQDLGAKDLPVKLSHLIPLTEEIKARLLAGNTQFTLDGYMGIDHISLVIYHNEKKEQYPMYHIDEKWQLGIDLAVGEYAYHFVLSDGTTILDPAQEATKKIEEEQYSLMVIP